MHVCPCTLTKSPYHDTKVEADLGRTVRLILSIFLWYILGNWFSEKCVGPWKGRKVLGSKGRSQTQTCWDHLSHKWDEIPISHLSVSRIPISNGVRSQESRSQFDSQGSQDPKLPFWGPYIGISNPLLQGSMAVPCNSVKLIINTCIPISPFGILIFARKSLRPLLRLQYWDSIHVYAELPVTITLSPFFHDWCKITTTNKHPVLTVNPSL